jgi:ParB family chromosome partitioning protein
MFKVNKKKISYNKNADIRDLETSITEKIGLSVNITNQRNNKGKITFEYKSLDQLNKLIEVIKSSY